ncbi:hypothetical protein H5410_030554 [Solanum commersonii]|uniref:Uncharacterized protein n=1 Tax=Solanum commersonii TaxID=4109 RepID=A0A9J5YHQ2_SOLCO|nr:hypothetical protein H5410_030554 [Solanum commersonii]
MNLSLIIEDLANLYHEILDFEKEWDALDYPPIFLNNHKEPDILEVDDDQDGMTDDPIPKRRPKQMTTILKKKESTRAREEVHDHVRIYFEFSCIISDWLTAIAVTNRNVVLTTQYIAANINILLEHAFVSSLPRMLVGHTMTIIDDRFKSIAIPHIGYIRQAIFQALDSICMKRSILKQIVRSNPSLEKACSRSDLVTKCDCCCSSRQERQKSVKQYQRFKLLRPHDSQSRMNKPWTLCEEFPKSERSVKTLQLYHDIADSTRMYLSRDNDHESVFSLEDEPTEVDTPYVQLAIYSAKRDKALKFIAFMDTRATSSILNLEVLPND